jgi:hypothetical protein
MLEETRESELKRLQTEQRKMREDEVFGGLSVQEQAEYKKKVERIGSLEIEIREIAVP